MRSRWTASAALRYFLLARRPPSRAILESLVTVTFQKKGEDTLLTLHHENLPDDEGGRGHEKGWGYFLSRFADRFFARS